MSLTPQFEATLDSLGRVHVPQGLEAVLKDVRGGVHAQGLLIDLSIARGIQVSEALSAAQEDDYSDEFYTDRTTHRLDFDEESFLQGLGQEGYDALMSELHEDFVTARLAKADANTAKARKAYEDTPVNGKMCVDACYDAADFQAWIQAEDSADCWQDNDFLRHQDKTVGNRVKRSQSRNSIIVPATKYTRISRV